MNRAALLIAVMALCTAALRALPFLFMPEKKETPELIVFLGEHLPPAMIAMLCVYCLRSTDLKGPSHGIPELISVIAVCLLQKWKHSSLISVGGGTLLYMILIRILL